MSVPTRHTGHPQFDAWLDACRRYLEHRAACADPRTCPDAAALADAARERCRAVPWGHLRRDGGER